MYRPVFARCMADHTSSQEEHGPDHTSPQEEHGLDQATVTTTATGPTK